jgi:2-methylcitrate dehydratase PrpD
VAETGVQCAQLAECGMTGPLNFLTGVYGYLHLYGRDKVEAASVVEGLGSSWRLTSTVFKKYPSCGGTQAMTELALDLVRVADLTPARVESISVHVRPYTFKLVGHPFRLGDNPRVNAQFSAQYCVASAIVRRGCELAHFRPMAIADPAVLALVDRIRVVSEDRLSRPGEPVAVLAVHTIDGHRHELSLDFAPGFPGNLLTNDQHRARFDDCMNYAPFPLEPARIESFLSGVDGLASLEEATLLLDSLRTPAAYASLMNDACQTLAPNPHPGTDHR